VRSNTVPTLISASTSTQVPVLVTAIVPTYQAVPSPLHLEPHKITTTTIISLIQTAQTPIPLN